jgi:NADH:ubiquinone oxidoreductase subunit 2 (subunit N)
VTTAISAGYYLYVIMVMFMRPRAEGMAVPARAGGLTRTVLVIAVLATLIIGVAPDLVVRVAQQYARPTLGVPPEIAAQIVRSMSPTGPGPSVPRQ